MSGHNKGVVVGRVNSKLLEFGPEVPYTFHWVIRIVLQGFIMERNNR